MRGEGTLKLGKEYIINIINKLVLVRDNNNIFYSSNVYDKAKLYYFNFNFLILKNKEKVYLINRTNDLNFQLMRKKVITNLRNREFINKIANNNKTDNKKYSSITNIQKKSNRFKSKGK